MAKYLLANQCPFHHDWKGIGKQGHLNVLQWVRAHGPQLWALRTWQSSKLGHLTSELPLSGFCEGAAFSGHTCILEWASEQGLLPKDGLGTSRAAAHGDNLHILKWAQQQGLPLSRLSYPSEVGALGEAAQHRDLNMVLWLHSQGCTWDHLVIGHACQHGHLETAQWALQHGCPWPQWLEPSVYERAAFNGKS